VLLCISTSYQLLAIAGDGLNPWWNYPGLELWKFANLLIFIAAAFYLHRRFGNPIREALRSRGEAIKRDLIEARQQRDEALAKLAEVESRFAGLDAEVAKVRERAKAEAEAEKQRIAAITEEEIRRAREQAIREIEIAGKAVRQELRRFAAEKSVRLAEVILEREMGVEDDVRLTKLNVEELGRTEA
jgi:F-type H+-transporting ATPase subunit b